MANTKSLAQSIINLLALAGPMTEKEILATLRPASATARLTCLALLGSESITVDDWGVAAYERLQQVSLVAQGRIRKAGTRPMAGLRGDGEVLYALA